jgi:hypothetical protein
VISFYRATPPLTTAPTQPTVVERTI